MAQNNVQLTVKELASDARIQQPLVVKVVVCMALTNPATLHKAQTIRNIGTVKEPRNRLKNTRKHYYDYIRWKRLVITLSYFQRARLELVEENRLVGNRLT
jgi:hypothetical protein